MGFIVIGLIYTCKFTAYESKLAGSGLAIANTKNSCVCRSGRYLAYETHYYIAACQLADNAHHENYVQAALALQITF